MNGADIAGQDRSFSHPVLLLSCILFIALKMCCGTQELIKRAKGVTNNKLSRGQAHLQKSAHYKPLVLPPLMSTNFPFPNAIYNSQRRVLFYNILDAFIFQVDLIVQTTASFVTIILYTHT